MSNAPWKRFVRGVAALGADDIFVSYSRKDAADFALALSNALGERGFTCFLDQRLNEPGKDLGASVLQALAQSSMMVLIVSTAAAQSSYVGQEVVAFRSHRSTRPLVILDVANAAEGAIWRAAIEGAYRNLLTADEVARAVPRADLLDRVVNAATFVRRNKRLRRIGQGLSFLILGLSVAAVFLGRNVAVQQKEVNKIQEHARLAQADLDKAKVARDQATEEMKSAQRQTDIARGERKQAVDERDTAVAEAKSATQAAAEQRGVAESRQLAMSAQSIGEYSPERALAGAVAAMKRAQTREAKAGFFRALRSFEPFVPLKRSGELANVFFDETRHLLAAKVGDSYLRTWQVDSGDFVDERYDPDDLQEVVGAAGNGELILSAYHKYIAWNGRDVRSLPGSPYEDFGYPFLFASNTQLMASLSDDAVRLFPRDGGVSQTCTIENTAASEPRDLERPVPSLRFIKNGRGILAVTPKGKIVVFDTADCNRAERGDLSGPPAGAVALRPQGDLVVVPVRGKDSYTHAPVELWQLSPLKKLSGVDDHCAGEFCDFSGDGEALAVGNIGAARICRLSEPDKVLIADPPIDPERPLEGLDLSPRGNELLLLTRDSVLIHDATNRLLKTRLRGQEDGFSGAVFTPEGSQILTWGRFGARLWRPSGKTRSVVWVLPKFDLSRSALSPDGSAVVVGDADGGVSRIDAEHQQLVRTTEPGSYSSRHIPLLSFDATGAQLALVSGGGEASVVRTKDWKSTKLPFADEGQQLVVDAAGRTAVLSRWRSNQGDSALEVWDIPSATLRSTRLDSPKDTFPVSVESLALSSDGQLIAASTNESFDVWTIGSKAPLLHAPRAIEGTTWRHPVFDRSGRLLVGIATDAMSARVWMITSQGRDSAPSRLVTLHDPELFVRVAFSSDGHWLASTGIKDEVKVWDLETGDYVARLSANGSQGEVAFLGTSRSVVSLSAGATIGGLRFGVALVTDECTLCRPLSELLPRVESSLSRAQVRWQD